MEDNLKKQVIIILISILIFISYLHTQRSNTKLDFPDQLNPEEMKGVLQVKGHFLYDSGGKKIILRGVEDFINNHIDEIAKTGTNAYRMAYSTTAEELEFVLQKAICEHNMIVSVMNVHGYNETTWWNSPEIKAVLKKYESHITLHAYAEAPYDGALPGSDERWLQETMKVIKEIRSYGYICPIEVLANSWGQNVKVLLKYGQKVIDSDPEHNIILGYQVYSTTRLEGANKMTIETALKVVAESGLPMILGSCAFTDEKGNQLYGSPVDGWKRVWRGSYDYGISCYYWCWSGSPSWLPSQDALCLDGYYGNWSKYGVEICGNNKYSIANTSIKSSRKIENWPPISSKKIKDLVINKNERQVDNYINVKDYFTDHGDDTEMTYLIDKLTQPDMVSAKIDKEGNLDLFISEESFGTYRILVIAKDSGGKETSNSFTVRVIDPDRKNIALNKNVSISSVKDNLNGKNINDGNTYTRWGSEWKNDQWVVIDLAGQYTIDAFTLNWEAAYGISYEIQVSNDNKNWKRVYVESNGDGGIDEFSIKPVTARYVKNVGLEAATPWGFSLWEFAVYEKKK